MTRRRFMFWLGFGLFGLAEKLRADSLDAVAAAAMDAVEPASAVAEMPWPVHWTVVDDGNWRWYEREYFIDGQWMLTGSTPPFDKETGELNDEEGVYIDESLVPTDVRVKDNQTVAIVGSDLKDESDLHLPELARRKRHGRPPSKWLRSLHAEELHIWLKTIQVPEADVSGMTYWTHLTRDHLFDAEKIKGLAEVDQAKLHAAAHFGY